MQSIALLRRCGTVSAPLVARSSILAAARYYHPRSAASPTTAPIGTLFESPLAPNNTAAAPKFYKENRPFNYGDLMWGEAVDGLGRAFPKNPEQTPAERWSSRSSNILKKLAPPPNTYAGRSVVVEKGDVGNAYNRLQGILARNDVRKELRLTERHEKRSDKRRRLESERHRRRFAEFIRKKVQLVKAIRARGA